MDPAKMVSNQSIVTQNAKARSKHVTLANQRRMREAQKIAVLLSTGAIARETLDNATPSGNDVTVGKLFLNWKAKKNIFPNS
jgi:hypothetical protein